LKSEHQKSEISNQQSAQSSVLSPRAIRIALFTGGGDKPYALGMAQALTSKVYSLIYWQRWI